MSAKKLTVDFSLHPDMLSKHLGKDMYRATEALKQLVANSFDSGCNKVAITLFSMNWGLRRASSSKTTELESRKMTSSMAFKTSEFTTTAPMLRGKSSAPAGSVDLPSFLFLPSPPGTRYHVTPMDCGASAGR